MLFDRGVVLAVGQPQMLVCRAVGEGAMSREESSCESVVSFSGLGVEAWLQTEEPLVLHIRNQLL